MASRERKAMQKTRPKKGKPVEIPVPKRKDVLADLKKVAGKSADKRGRP